MSYANTRRFSISGFAFACCLTVVINGSVLLGFNHLAQSHDTVNANTASQMADSAVPATREAM
jgi:CHASE3 domain sensor protein